MLEMSERTIAAGVGEQNGSPVESMLLADGCRGESPTPLLARASAAPVSAKSVKLHAGRQLSGSPVEISLVVGAGGAPPNHFLLLERGQACGAQSPVQHDIF